MDNNYQKNQILEVEITDMSENGEGIGKVSGYTLFVKDAVIGDKIKARLTKVKKNYSYARLEEIITPSKNRIAAPCPISRQCGGCQIQALEYSGQLRFKEMKVKNDLVRIGGFDAKFIESIAEPIVGMETPFRYRNKAQYPVGWRKTANKAQDELKGKGSNDVKNRYVDKGVGEGTSGDIGRDYDRGIGNLGLHNIGDCESRFITGFYAGRTHNIIENDDCLIGCEENKDILNTVISYMNREGVPAYDETTGKGIIRHVLIRKGFTTGEIMVCLVVNLKDDDSDLLNLKINKSVGKSGSNSQVSRDNLKYLKHLKRIDTLISVLEKIHGMTSISININNGNTNVIMGEKSITLWGKDHITDYIGDVRFNISPLSFFQVNPVQTKRLYEKTLEYADLKGDEIVWDLYCGIGTISLFMARFAKKVYGVEIVEQAILDARENAKINGIENVEFIVGAAEDVVIQNKGNSFNLEAPDVVIVDPPRKGCDESLLNTILQLQPSKIVYISCNPATLSRDLKYLTGSYSTESYLTKNYQTGSNRPTGECLTRDGQQLMDNRQEVPAAQYELTKFRPYDLFPQTVHVETVALLTQHLA